MACIVLPSNIAYTQQITTVCGCLDNNDDDDKEEIRMDNGDKIDEDATAVPPKKQRYRRLLPNSQRHMRKTGLPVQENERKRKQKAINTEEEGKEGDDVNDAAKRFKPLETDLNDVSTITSKRSDITSLNATVLPVKKRMIRYSLPSTKKKTRRRRRRRKRKSTKISKPI